MASRELNSVKKHLIRSFKTICLSFATRAPWFARKREDRYALHCSEVEICKIWGGKRECIMTHDISRITAVCLDKVTYKEIFLSIQSRNGKVLTFGELDRFEHEAGGFQRLIDTMKTEIPALGTKWRELLEGSGQSRIEMILYEAPSDAR